MHITLCVYGIGCVVGALFVAFVLKETSGQSLDDIGMDDEQLRMQKFHASRINSLC